MLREGSSDVKNIFRVVMSATAYSCVVTCVIGFCVESISAREQSCMLLDVMDFYFMPAAAGINLMEDILLMIYFAVIYFYNNWGFQVWKCGFCVTSWFVKNLFFYDKS